MNKKNKILLFIILSLVIVFIFILKPKNNIVEPVNPKPIVKEPDKVGTNYLNNIKYTKNIDKEIETKIIEFFNVYYNSVKELTENDMTYLFEDKNLEDALINQTAVSLLIETRKLKPNDLRLEKVSYDLDIKKVEKSNDKIIVTVLENNCLNFKFMKEIDSKVYNIENKFTFKKNANEYKLVNYDKVQDFYVMITDVYKNGGKEELDKIKLNYLNIINKQITKDKKFYSEFLNNENKPYKKVDHEFNRENAKKEIGWVNKRNPEWLEFGSNCQNFASYVLYAGGIPTDSIGDKETIWDYKMINKEYYSWTYVPGFRQYALKNTGYGLVSTVDANIYYGDTGDVIQVGTTNSVRHALVVNRPYYKDDKVIDILVNSNTVDLENFPISAYSYPYVSLIKIHGWNEK